MSLSESTETQVRPPLSSPFRLGCWRVQPALNQIAQDDGEQQRHLEPRLMNLLCFLAANHGEVLSRDILVQQLWPRVVVNENSLTRAVSELRKQLQNGTSDKAIQTIPKRGYRLLLPVTPLATEKRAAHEALAPVHAAGSGSTSTDTESPGATADQSRHWLWAVSGLAPVLLQRPLTLAAGAACLSLALSLGLGSMNQPEVLNPYLARPLLADQVVGEDSIRGAVFMPSVNWQEIAHNSAPALSANGKRYAFIHNHDNGSTIFLGSLTEAGQGQAYSDPVVIYESDCRLVNLAWSPLGDALLFARTSPIAPAAQLGGNSGSTELLSLDLDSLKLSRLVEAAPEPPQTPDAPVVNLTATSRTTAGPLVS